MLRKTVDLCINEKGEGEFEMHTKMCGSVARTSGTMATLTGQMKKGHRE